MNALSEHDLQPNSSDRSIWLGYTLAVLLALLGVRILALQWNATDLFFDEAQYWMWGEELAFGYFSKPPVLGWIIRATTDVFGEDVWVLRLASPVIHTVTALVVFQIAKALHSAQAGFWSAVGFATLPGISFSSGIISTDVPLLMFWAFTLWMLVIMLKRVYPPLRPETQMGMQEADTPTDAHSGALWMPGIGFGISLGLGMMSKYAILFPMLGLALYLLTTPPARTLLTKPGFWLGLAIAGVILAPNIWWNIQNGAVTVSHTAANANWGSGLFKPHKALEFFGAQFGVFGPIFFGTLCVVTWRAWHEGLSDAGRLLLCLSVPIVLLITVQGFLSRAHANWAATAYIAGVVLVVIEMIRLKEWGWLKGSVALHLALMAVIIIGTSTADKLTLPWNGAKPFARTLGWRETATELRGILADTGKTDARPEAILTVSREISAEVLYYLRDIKLPIRAFKPDRDAAPHDHFEMTRPFPGKTALPAQRFLLISPGKKVPGMDKFSSSKLLKEIAVPTGTTLRRTYVYLVEGFTP